MAASLMNYSTAFLAALLLAPPGASAQEALVRDLAKPEVAIATKAAKRAWEFAPPEKKALWQQQRDALINLDLSEDTQRQIIIARGTSEPDGYHAHPTTAMLADETSVSIASTSGRILRVAEDGRVLLDRASHTSGASASVFCSCSSDATDSDKFC